MTKIKEVGTVLGVILLVVVAYGALLWFPSSLLTEQGPNYFYEEVLEEQIVVEGSVTTNTTEKKGIQWVKFPILKDRTYETLLCGNLNGAEEASTHIRKHAIGGYLSKDDALSDPENQTMQGAVRLQLHELARRIDHMPTDQFIKLYVKEWRLEKIFLQGQETVDYDMATICSTNKHLVYFNNAPLTSWGMGHGKVISLWGMLGVLLFFVVKWLTSNYNKLTKKKKRK